MIDWWFLLVLAIAVVVIAMLVIVIRDVQEDMRWHYDFEGRLADLMALEQQHGSEETIEDMGAHGGAVTSAGYWSQQEKDTDTGDPLVMCADDTCRWFGVAHTSDHQSLPVMNDQWSHNR